MALRPDAITVSVSQIPSSAEATRNVVLVNSVLRTSVLMRNVEQMMSVALGPYVVTISVNKMCPSAWWTANVARARFVRMPSVLRAVEPTDNVAMAKCARGALVWCQNPSAARTMIVVAVHGVITAFANGILTSASAMANAMTDSAA